MNKAFYFILFSLISINVFNCEPHKRLYTKKSGDTKNIVYRYRHPNFESYQSLDIVSYKPSKKNKADYRKYGSIKDAYFHIQYWVCKPLNGQKSKHTNTWEIYKYSDEAIFLAITDTLNGYYQFERKMDFSQIPFVFTPLSMEEKALLEIAMKKRLPKAYKDDLRLIIGWAKVEKRLI